MENDLSLNRRELGHLQRRDKQKSASYGEFVQWLGHEPCKFATRVRLSHSPPADFGSVYRKNMLRDASNIKCVSTGSNPVSALWIKGGMAQRFTALISTNKVLHI